MDIRTLADDLLEVTVIGSFTRARAGHPTPSLRLVASAGPRPGRVGPCSSPGRPPGSGCRPLGPWPTSVPGSCWQAVRRSGWRRSATSSWPRMARIDSRCWSWTWPRSPRSERRSSRSWRRRRVSTPRRQRRRHLPAAHGQRGRHRGHPGDHGRRPIRTGQRAAAAPRSDRGSPRRVGHLGRHVRAGPRPDRPRVRQAALRRHAYLRARETGTGGAHARMGEAAPGRHDLLGACTLAGPTAPGWRRRCPASIGSWRPCSAHRPRVSTRSSGSSPTPPPRARTASSTWIGGRARSIGCPPPACRRPSGVGYGRWSSSWRASPIPCPTRRRPEGASGQSRFGARARGRRVAPSTR